MKIVGLLSKKGVTVAELAAMLERRPSTISHHLSRHARTGLVSPHAEGHYSVYKLETDALEGRVD
ncbi:MAG: winged helix-turn-helix transcriptional regulator [Chloroflexi bacterium]|nr:winged helix-turn-helix transcriptional regulator [Chloroflexota bacterium]